MEDVEAELLEAFLEESDTEEDSAARTPPPKRRRNAAPSQSASPQGDKAASRSPPVDCGTLSALPVELVLEVLACVSAVDLTAIAQTCRFLSNCSRTSDLWRALATARWGSQQEEESRLHDQSSWKIYYMERDASEVATVKEGVPASLQTFYVQMTTAKRHLTLPRHRKLAMPSATALLGRISRWRGVRGLLNCPSPALGSKHSGCSRRGPYAALQGGLFMCETCGWAHVCGDGCGERLLDQDSAQLVCPVSGRCFPRMLADWEDDGRDMQDGDAGCDFGIPGHWGRAFSQGYSCSKEELLDQYGVTM